MMKVKVSGYHIYFTVEQISELLEYMEGHSNNNCSSGMLPESEWWLDIKNKQRQAKDSKTEFNYGND